MNKITPFLLALGMSGAYAQQFCQVSDGSCAQKINASRTGRTITTRTFTARAVLVDSCTVCGKDPVTGR